MKTIITILALIAVGCSSQKQIKKDAQNLPPENQDQDWETSLNSYLDCMQEAAFKYYKSKSNTFELAQAAESLCNLDYESLELKLINYHLSNGRNELTAIKIGKNESESLKKRQKDNFIRRVVELRSSLN